MWLERRPSFWMLLKTSSEGRPGRSAIGVGALQQVKNAWGDFLEMLGGVMTPVINKVSKALMGVINILSAMVGRRRSS